MEITKSRALVVAGALLVGGACVASQPATAKDPTGSIDSREIKDGTIRPKDLNKVLRKRTKLATTALQEVPDNSVGAPEIAPNAVGAEELADDSVDSGAVVDGGLTAFDVATVRGVVTLDYGLIAAHSCQTITVGAGRVLDNDLILATPGPTMPGIITVTPRQQATGSSNIVFVACNGAEVALDPQPTPTAWAVLAN